MRGINKRAGFRLTAEAEELFSDWEYNYAGCTCHMGHPPCSSCTHPGHPICMEETEEFWERDYLGLVPDDDML